MFLKKKTFHMIQGTYDSIVYILTPILPIYITHILDNKFFSFLNYTGCVCVIYSYS